MRLLRKARTPAGGECPVQNRRTCENHGADEASLERVFFEWMEGKSQLGMVFMSWLDVAKESEYEHKFEESSIAFG